MAEEIRKYPIPSSKEEDREESLGILWAQGEQGLKKKQELQDVLKEAVRPDILDELIQDGFVSEKNGSLELTPKGEKIAKEIIRRQRLAERLFQDVLDLPQEQIDQNVCRMEHVITRDVEEAICTLLGHPEACPHGLIIPRGKCCTSAVEKTGPIVSTLSNIAAGREGRIVYLSPKNRPELHKLMSMGFVPGTVIRVEQTAPAFVVGLGNSLVALDASLAQSIFIRPTA